MAHINLLPWREELRQQKKKEFFTVVGGTAIAFAGVVLLVHMYMAGLIDYQNSRNDRLKAEITKVESKIEEIKDLERAKEQLIARMRVIEELQGNRPEVVHLFEEIAKVVPEGLFIDSITQKNRDVTIVGKAQSNARVSAFMRRLEASNWLETPNLNVISTSKREAERMREFTLVVSQVNYTEGSQ
ncbi:MAG: PilN domain-containing protein [Pseudomonadota bacterium]